MGHTLVAASIYLCLLCYVLAVAFWISGRHGSQYRILWTCGCLFLGAHTLFAFHFYHRWSHADAVELTARETEDILGVQFGAGIWFSYLLLLVWLASVIRIWSHNSSRTWNTPHYFVHAYVFFILFNGTVVFEQGAVRWAGIIGTIWLARLAWRFRWPLRTRSSTTLESSE